MFIVICYKNSKEDISIRNAIETNLYIYTKLFKGIEHLVAVKRIYVNKIKVIHMR